MKWTIDKRLDGFSYGHRVWTQELHVEFSEDTSCACKHLHGHNATIHVFLSSETLNRGFVTDFKHINWVKTFLNDTIDHKFIMDANDPMFNGLVVTVANTADPTIPLHVSPGEFITSYCEPIHVPNTEHVAAYKIKAAVYEAAAPHVQEVLEGFTIVQFVPTSEKLCQWLHTCVSVKMERLGVTVERIDWFETEKSRSSCSI